MRKMDLVNLQILNPSEVFCSPVGACISSSLSSDGMILFNENLCQVARGSNTCKAPEQSWISIEM